ncbi:MAG: hypothetical protein AAF726_09475 [Planctomycetota bacterium]
MQSRSFQTLSRSLQRCVLRVCLSEDDLRDLGCWDEERRSQTLSQAVLHRTCLQRACREDAKLAQRVTDRLDLMYLDTLVLIASMDSIELERMVTCWVEDPDGRALPALLWALLSDGRNRAHALGLRLRHEAEAIALDSFVQSGE